MGVPADAGLPPWACWLAQDADGAWWAFEVEPLPHHCGWYENEIGRYQAMGKNDPNPNWQRTLRKLR